MDFIIISFVARRRSMSAFGTDAAGTGSRIPQQKVDRLRRIALSDDRLVELSLLASEAHRHLLLVSDRHPVEHRLLAHEPSPRLELGRLGGAQRPTVQVAVDDDEIRPLVGQDRRVSNAVFVDERQLSESTARVCW